MLALPLLTTEDPCPYLPGRTSRTQCRQVFHFTPGEYEALLMAGWRKFGSVLYQPICPTCDACQPIRYPIAQLTLDRSQRRCLARNADLTVRFEAPTIDAQRLALYNRYHAEQQRRKGWPETDKSVEDYVNAFLENPVRGVEVSVWEGDSLRAIALTDITETIVSGVYHYHDLDHAHRGLGVFVMLQVFELARYLGKPWAHFGYWVADCPSLNYKARFRPCEALGRDGVWRALSEQPREPRGVEGPTGEPGDR